MEAKIYTDAFVGTNSWNGRERNHLMLNQRDGTFAELGAALGVDGLGDGRGLAMADFDHDGDVDLVVNNYRGPAAYYENRLELNQWVAVRLQGGAVGALVEATDDRGQKRVRLVSAGEAYAGQRSLEQIIGLGAETGASLAVRWSDGAWEEFGRFDAGQRVRLARGAGTLREAPNITRAEARSPWGWWGLLAAVMAIGVLLGRPRRQRFVFR